MADEEEVPTEHPDARGSGLTGVVSYADETPAPYMPAPFGEDDPGYPADVTPPRLAENEEIARAE
jgi:hypothetical protein